MIYQADTILNLHTTNKSLKIYKANNSRQLKEINIPFFHCLKMHIKSNKTSYILKDIIRVCYV